MSRAPEPHEYVLYIDEAGDDGLSKVMPIDNPGGSEWLVIGAALVRANNEPNVVDWIKEIRADINALQGPVLHYRNLSPTKRLRACELVAQKRAIYFAVCSNKKNMRGHSNERAAIKGGRQWYYNFCVRVLMERVTDLCYRDSIKKYGRPKYLKVVFSQRGGHSYGQTKAYWELLKNQSAAGTTFLSKRTIRHEVLRFQLVDYVPHAQLAGLQLADVIASSFFQAANTIGPNWNIEPAKILRPRIARKDQVIADYGVIIQPSPVWKAKLNPKQKTIFQYYGFSF